MSNPVHRTARVVTPSLRSNAVTAAAGFGVEQVIHTVALAQGTITSQEYGRRTAENAAGSAGGLGGGAAGAALGTLICPGIGTALGALIGGVLGSWGLARATRSVL